MQFGIERRGLAPNAQRAWRPAHFAGALHPPLKLGGVAERLHLGPANPAGGTARLYGCALLRAHSAGVCCSGRGSHRIQRLIGWLAASTLPNRHAVGVVRPSIARGCWPVPTVLPSQLAASRGACKLRCFCGWSFAPEVAGFHRNHLK